MPDLHDNRFPCYLLERDATEDLEQISSFRRVVEPVIRGHVMEIQNEHTTWMEYKKDDSAYTNELDWEEMEECVEFDQKYNWLQSVY